MHRGVVSDESMINTKDSSAQNKIQIIIHRLITLCGATTRQNERGVPDAMKLTIVTSLAVGRLAVEFVTEKRKSQDENYGYNSIRILVCFFFKNKISYHSRASRKSRF